VVKRATGLGVALAGALTIAAGAAGAADYYSGLGYKDGPALPLAAWTGFYAGLNGGYALDAWSSHGGVLDDGAFGGAQAGYNWQGAFGLSRQLVLGAEADFEGTGIAHAGYGTLTDLTTHVTYPDYHKRSIGEFGTIRGRAGYAWERTLFYVTGGFAYGTERNIFDNLTTGNIYKADGLQTGYILGGGFEYKITPTWSLKAEYQYIDLAGDRPVGDLGGYVSTRDTELNTFRSGVNFHFN
jgi:outer membrane immunogenic protein